MAEIIYQLLKETFSVLKLSKNEMIWYLNEFVNIQMGMKKSYKAYKFKYKNIFIILILYIK